MPTSQTGYPLSNVVNFMIGYLQNVIFNNLDIVPTIWAYDPNNERASRIRIEAPFNIDYEKPLSQPFIVIERGGFRFDKRVINDTKRADANTLDNEEKVLTPQGPIIMTCGSGSAEEATNIANFLVMIIAMSRPHLYGYSKLITYIRCLQVGEEIPAYKGNDIQRYEVSVIFDVKIQFGMRFLEEESTQFNKFSVRAIKTPYELISDSGEYTLGSNVFTDNNTKFGEDVLFSPQELAGGFYEIRIECMSEYHLVIDSINYEPAESWGYSVNLKRKKSDGTYVPWEFEEDDENINYKLAWSEMRLNFNYPGEQQ